MMDSPPRGFAERAAAARSDFERTAWFPGLDGLRGLAITAVIWHHCLPRAWPGWLGRGHAGVPLFFALSGFLITHLLIAEWRRRGDIALGWFWLRRCLRIFPLYYAVLAGFVAWLWLADETDNTRHFFASLPFYATYTSTWFVDYAVTHPVSFGFAWSLAVEEQFYVFWPPLLRASLRRSWWLAVAAAIALLAFDQCAEAGAFAAWLPVGQSPHRIATSFAPALLLGALLALGTAHARGFVGLFALLGGRASVLGCLALSGALIAAPVGPPILLDLAFAALVGASVLSRGRSSRLLALWPFTRLGQVSYGLYLFHVPVIGALRRLAPALAEQPLALFPLVFVASYGIAALSHRYVELPLLGLRERFRPRSEAEAPSTAPALAIPARIEA
jgi:peptidoglycan/LPS O-acetylase OafA/YrhL